MLIQGSSFNVFHGEECTIVIEREHQDPVFSRLGRNVGILQMRSVNGSFMRISCKLLCWEGGNKYLTKIVFSICFNLGVHTFRFLFLNQHWQFKVLSRNVTSHARDPTVCKWRDNALCTIVSVAEEGLASLSY